MPDDALKRPEWIDSAAEEIAIELVAVWPERQFSRVADIIEHRFDAHVATLPVAEPCGHAGLLRECRPLLADIRGPAAASLVERIDRELERHP